MTEQQNNKLVKILEYSDEIVSKLDDIISEVLHILDENISEAEDNLLTDIVNKTGSMLNINKELQMTVHILKTVVGEGLSN